MSQISNRELLRRAARPGWESYVQDALHIRMARWYAAQRGFKIDGGNWIRTKEGRPICQGWPELYRRIKGGPLAQEMDRL
jgi:hypothetical protein